MFWKLFIKSPLDCQYVIKEECDLRIKQHYLAVITDFFVKKKKSVEDKECGPLIKTIMTRWHCVHVV
jgi:hypothetical protein